jgi:hypothetical protein
LLEHGLSSKGERRRRTWVSRVIGTFRLGQRTPGQILRVVLTACGGLAAVVALSGPTLAAAATCDGPQGKCYAVGIASTSQGNLEIDSVLCESTLSVPSPSTEYATDEMWETMNNASYWTEAGIQIGSYSGKNIHGYTTQPHSSGRTARRLTGITSTSPRRQCRRAMESLLRAPASCAILRMTVGRSM